MPIRDNREYRALPIFTPEKREENSEASFIVEGYASTFDEYKLFDLDEKTAVYERIEPTAFDNTDMSDVIFQVDHEGPVYARTSNNTISLYVDSVGLHQRADLSKTERARQVFEEIKAGMYPQMSFAFTVEEDEIIREDEARILRVVKKVKRLFDVSAVSFPANPNTSISVSARNALDGFIEGEKVELLKRAKEKEIELAKARYFEEV